MQIDSLYIPWDSLKAIHNWNDFNYIDGSVSYINEPLTIPDIVDYCIIFFLLYIALLLIYSKVSDLSFEKKEKEEVD